GLAQGEAAPVEGEFPATPVVEPTQPTKRTAAVPGESTILEAQPALPAQPPRPAPRKVGKGAAAAEDVKPQAARRQREEEEVEEEEESAEPARRRKSREAEEQEETAISSRTLILILSILAGTMGLLLFVISLIALLRR